MNLLKVGHVISMCTHQIIIYLEVNISKAPGLTRAWILILHYPWRTYRHLYVYSLRHYAVKTLQYYDVAIEYVNQTIYLKKIILYYIIYFEIYFNL